MQESIRVNPDPHLGFFNRANNISLKVHAFQLLPGVGSSTAQSWVKIRGQNGWVDLAEVSEKLGVEVVDLLAERYVGELAEPAEVPSLLDLLVRVSA
jgi:predicted nucleic acid-binding OB-fold protein